MAQAYIVEALRTAGGKRGGALRGWHPADMGAEILNALAACSGIDPAASLPPATPARFVMGHRAC